MIPRLYVSDDLTAGAVIHSSDAHYLRNVLRLGADAEVEMFNGRDGGWRGQIVGFGKRSVDIMVTAAVAQQTTLPDLALLFAPIKKTRVDFLVEKATELGVTSLWPVFTRHAITNRVNTARLSEVARQAAEQCGRLCVPVLETPAPLKDCLALLERRRRRLFIADETGDGHSATTAFTDAGDAPAAILIGPEGGFATSELDLMRRLSIVTAINLGPRILRAETAAIAALACWQAVCGDWRSRGR